jgi:NAD+ kinase
MSPIKRIGIVLKPNQPDALRTVCELVSWLDERGISLIGTPEIERDRIQLETGCVVEQVPREELAANVDQILVLGGDGTISRPRACWATAKCPSSASTMADSVI